MLRQGDSIFISDKDKTEALNDYLQSVFTKDKGLLPAFSPSIPSYIINIRDMVFPPNCVLKELASLNPSKSAGPESAEISSMLTFIFQQGSDTGTLPNYWLTAMVHVLSTRNQARKTQLMIGPYALRSSAIRWWSILCLATWITSVWQKLIVSSTTLLPC